MAKKWQFFIRGRNRFYFCYHRRRIRLYRMLHCDIFTIVNYFTMYYNWIEIPEFVRANYMWRNSGTHWFSKFYQHGGCNRSATKHRIVTAICQCRSNIDCLLLHGNWFCIKCRFTTEKILKESGHEYRINRS